MIIATDVHYDDDNDTARAAAVAFSSWSDATPAYEWVVEVEGLEEYEPGQFYKRELPCLEKLLEASPVGHRTVIVDGHVWLQKGRPGLGHYLWKELGETTPVVGIAKRAFHRGCAFRLNRGTKNPLFVTVQGMHEVTLQGYVHQIHGPYRIPTLLKRVDQLARGLVTPAGAS